MLKCRPACSLILLAMLMASGCRKEAAGPDPAAIAQHRSRFELADEPPGAINVLELRENLLGESPSEPGDAPPVVVVGKIGGIPNPWRGAEPDYPWVKGMGRFFLADAAASMEIAAETHAHKEGEECPFCANAAQAEAITVVRLLDTDGKQIGIDCRDLLELKKGQTVVVRGAPTITGTGKDAVLILDADAVYVRK